jgi:copper oxidase (laccase) domain-containing protein
VRVLQAAGPGELGDADGLWTDRTGLPLAVFTADCLGIVLHAEAAVGVAHAGWRGVAAGVVPALRTEMERAGHRPVAASIGPGIGPCCFEVGSDVTELLPTEVTETTWRTPSVDLTAAVRRQLEGLDVWLAGACTMHDPGFYSHRQTRTALRLATIGWV